MHKVEKDDFIKSLIENGALLFGDFKLKSGRKSPFFINMGEMHSGNALDTLGFTFARSLFINGSPNIIFGPAYKGIMLASVTAAYFYFFAKKELDICFNRKEEKSHGEGGLFIGRIPSKGDKVVIIDDVITNGLTKKESISIIESKGAEVAYILVGVDRRIEKTNDLNCPLVSLVDLNDIKNYLQKNKMDDEFKKLEKFMTKT